MSLDHHPGDPVLADLLAAKKPPAFLADFLAANFAGGYADGFGRQHFRPPVTRQRKSGSLSRLIILTATPSASEEYHNNVVVLGNYYAFIGEDYDVNNTINPSVLLRLSSSPLPFVFN
ncbi:hypothetical protein PHJA_000077800 [Phtheirospermum japonicum]|uniref:Uncharacterized protein n=1 Tax=Phtheirospermum japonicum TaxID=374723 RepID=A0A830B3W9_9LAMI|nr:hypothetical protein PHJA_000077800 [Phtheirospermum japonicum]